LTDLPVEVLIPPLEGPDWGQYGPVMDEWISVEKEPCGLRCKEGAGTTSARTDSERLLDSSHIADVTPPIDSS
jgi:hypothetical protein